MYQSYVIVFNRSRCSMHARIQFDACTYDLTKQAQLDAPSIPIPNRKNVHAISQSSTVRDFTCTICTYVRTHGVIPIDTRSSPCVRTDTLTKLTIHGYDRCIYVVPRPNLSRISRLTVALVHSKKLIKVRQKKRSTIVQS